MAAGFALAVAKQCHRLRTGALSVSVDTRPDAGKMNTGHK